MQLYATILFRLFVKIDDQFKYYWKGRSISIMGFLGASPRISHFDDQISLNLMMSKIRKGDIICVVRLDRLGRRITKLIDLIGQFKEKGVEFISLENNIDTTGPRNSTLIEQEF
jgi:hypothetical protein